MFDEIPTETVICGTFLKMSTVRQHGFSRSSVISLISDVLTKFKSVSGLIFRSKKEQDTAVKNLLSNRDVHAVLQPGYSKSFQMHVMARDINNMYECILVICPLTSLIKD